MESRELTTLAAAALLSGSVYTEAPALGGGVRRPTIEAIQAAVVTANMILLMVEKPF